jgi:hypothetical protein
MGKGYFIYVTFAYSIANILYFLIGRSLFKKVNTKKAMIVSIFLASIFFFCALICTQFLNSAFIQKILLIVFIILYSFFNGFYQGRLSGFGSSCGSISIQGYSLGTGIAGFGSNVIAIAFYLIFHYTKTDDNVEKDLERQMISYMIVLPLIFLAYLITLYMFLRKYGHFVNVLDEELKKKEEELLLSSNKVSKSDRQSVKTMKTFTSWRTSNSERKYSVFSIIKRIIDIWFAMIFTYFLTIQSLTFILPNLADKFDNNGELYILIYIFLYNSGDTIGKMMPDKWNMESTFLVHFLSIARLIFYIYFMFMIYTTPHKFFSHYIFRGIIFLIIGISNGYLTNNFFIIPPSRFRNLKNKDFAGYLMIFALIIGVTFGTFAGVLWTL